MSARRSPKLLPSDTAPDSNVSVYVPGSGGYVWLQPVNSTSRNVYVPGFSPLPLSSLNSK